MERARITIFDTTLRDGEQSPGCSMNVQEKLRMAHQLDRLGVDVIEAGFPIASEGDFAAVQAIAATIRRPDHRRPGPRLHRRTSSAPGRRSRAPRGRASTSSWPPPTFTCKYKLQDLATAVSGAGRAMRCVWPSLVRRRGVFSGGRHPHRSGISVRGARCGGRGRVPPRSTSRTRSATACRRSSASMIQSIRQRVRGIEKVTISAHCHNDLGLAVANSLAAIAGRRAPGGVHHQRHRRARRQCLAGRDRDGHARPSRPLSVRDRRGQRAAVSQPASCSARSPACRCSPTRPSSGAMPLRTKPASIRTAC